MIKMQSGQERRGGRPPPTPGLLFFGPLRRDPRHNLSGKGASPCGRYSLAAAFFAAVFFCRGISSLKMAWLPDLPAKMQLMVFPLAAQIVFPIKTAIGLIAEAFLFYQASLMYMYIFVSLVFLLKRRLQAAPRLLRRAG